MPVPSWYCVARGWAFLCRAGERANLHQWDQSQGETSSTAGVLSRQTNPFSFSWSIPHYQTELSCGLHQQRWHMCWWVHQKGGRQRGISMYSLTFASWSSLFFAQMWTNVYSRSRASMSAETPWAASSASALQVTSSYPMAGTVKVESRSTVSWFHQ